VGRVTFLLWLANWIDRLENWLAFCRTGGDALRLANTVHTQVGEVNERLLLE